MGAAQDDGPYIVGRALGGHGHRGVQGLGVGVLHGVGEAGAGHLGDVDPGGEVADQPPLVRAARGGRGGPDGDGSAADRRGLDRRDGPDHGDLRLQLGADRVQGVHGGRVAGDDQGVGAVRGGGPYAAE